MKIELTGVQTPAHAHIANLPAALADYCVKKDIPLLLVLKKTTLHGPYNIWLKAEIGSDVAFIEELEAAAPLPAGKEPSIHGYFGEPFCSFHCPIGKMDIGMMNFAISKYCGEMLTVFPGLKLDWCYEDDPKARAVIRYPDPVAYLVRAALAEDVIVIVTTTDPARLEGPVTRPGRSG